MGRFIGKLIFVMTALGAAAHAQEFVAPSAPPQCETNCAPGINYSDWLQNPQQNYGLVANWHSSSQGTHNSINESGFNFHSERKTKFDGSNVLFMILGVGGIGAAVAFGGGGGSSNKSSAPAMTATVAPPATVAISGYQIQTGTTYNSQISRIIRADEHQAVSCLLTMADSTQPQVSAYIDSTLTIRTPQMTIINSPDIPSRPATVTLAVNRFSETLTVSILITSTANAATTTRVARQVKIYNTAPITLTFTQINGQAAISQNITISSTVVQTINADKISIEIEGRTAAERERARKLVTLPSNGVFSVTIINLATLVPITTEMMVDNNIIKYDNRMYAFSRGGSVTMIWGPRDRPGGEDVTLTLSNDFNGDYLASLAVSNSLHLYGVNFNHTLANLIDNKYIATVSGEKDTAVTLTTYSPRQALGATLLFSRDVSVGVATMTMITTTTMTTTMPGPPMTEVTATTTMTLVTTNTIKATTEALALTLMNKRQVYKNSKASNEGRTMYILSPYAIDTTTFVNQKFEAKLTDPKFIILKRYTTEKEKDRFIRLHHTFFRNHQQPAKAQFHSNSLRSCIGNAQANEKTGDLHKYFYIDQRDFSELSGTSEIYPRNNEDHILRFNYHEQNKNKFRVQNFAFSHGGQLNDLAAEYSTNEYINGRLKLQAAAGIRHLRSNKTKAQYYANYYNYTLGSKPADSLRYNPPLTRFRLHGHFVGGRVISEHYEDGRLLGYGTGVYANDLFTQGDFWYAGIKSPFADRRLNYKIFSLGTVLGNDQQNLILDYQRLINSNTDYFQFKYQHNFSSSR